MKIPFTVFITCLFIVFSYLAKAESFTITSMEGSMYTQLNERIMREAYKRIGIDIIVEKYPAKRALKISNAGQVDGELFRIANLNRKWKNLFVVPTPIAYLEGKVYSKKVDFKISGWDSLKPYRIGIKSGILHALRGTEGMKRQIVDTNAQLFQILKKDRVDIIVLAYFNAIKELNKIDFPDIKLLKPSIFLHPVYHYLHKKHQDLIPKLDKVIQEMTKEGLIKKYRDQYVSELYRN